MRLSPHKLLCGAWLLAFGLLAGSPAQGGQGQRQLIYAARE